MRRESSSYGIMERGPDLPVAPSFPHSATPPDSGLSENAVDRWASAIERNRFRLLIAFSCCYFALSMVRASQVSLWADEVLTAYLSRLDWHNVMGALTDGADIEPPLFHAITRFFTSIFGESNLTLRLPAILGGWLMCVSLYSFVARRFSAVYAFAAMLIPLVTIVQFYTVEARSYGIAMGFAGIALLCWQSAATGRRRALSCAGLALSLAAAISCHYYMALMAVALTGGELVRSRIARRIDWPIFAMIAVGVCALLPHLPFIQAAMTFNGGAWSAPSLSSLIMAHESFLWHGIGLAIAIGIGVVLCDSLLSRPTWNPKTAGIDPKAAFTSPELAVITLLSFGMLGTFVLALLTNGTFAPRYGLITAYGLAAVAVALLAKHDKGWPVAGLLALTVLSAGWIVLCAGEFNKQKTDVRDAAQLVLQAPAAAAVIVQDPLRFLEMEYSAPPPVRSRLYYLQSAQAALQYSGSSDDDRGLLLLSRRTPLSVEDAPAFLNLHRQFVLLWSPQSSGWLMTKLMKDGAKLAILATEGNYFLFSVELPPQTS
jgi:hypothetical protein